MFKPPTNVSDIDELREKLRLVTEENEELKAKLAAFEVEKPMEVIPEPEVAPPADPEAEPEPPQVGEAEQMAADSSQAAL